MNTFIAALLLFLSPLAWADVDDKPLHTSGDRQLWHRKENRIELFGHAVVSQPGETLTADYVTVDMNTRVLDAKGNCVYVSSGSVIHGEEMHFNLDTRTGSIIGGRVSNELFTLSGERINKLGEGRFQTHRGEYTTCLDCPGSWSLVADDVDMQVEGYAYMSSVLGKVKDIPAFWLPYLVVPMKTRRQTGFLFPIFSATPTNGFSLVEPFFWAINRSADMTIGLGAYTKRGARFQWEGRYQLSSRSGGKANFYFLRDRSFVDFNNLPLRPNRWALDVSQYQVLPFGIEQKLRLLEMSDNAYPREVGDVPGSGELSQVSGFSLSRSFPGVSTFIEARRIRNLINTNPDPVEQKLEFDPRTVQVFPNAVIATNDAPLLGLPVVGGLRLGVTHFTRSGDAFDYDNSQVPFGTQLPAGTTKAYLPGVDPIRKATRVSIVPSLYTTLRPFDVVSLVPSLKYYSYLYTFPQSQSPVGNLQRGYLLFQTDLSTQLEKIYESPETPETATKHLIRPLLTYSHIPRAFVREDPNHPFLKQISYATSKNIPGYYFDDYDIVPISNSSATTNYFVPLGNTLSMGLTTQWIRRNGAFDIKSMPSYTKFVEATLGQSVSFGHVDRDESFSRLFSTLELNLGRFVYNHQYYYYPYAPRYPHTFVAATRLQLSDLSRGGLFQYDRSLSISYAWDQHLYVEPKSGTQNINLGLTYSITDYILPSGSISYSFLDRGFNGAGLNIQFQSPSSCWRFGLSMNYTLDRGLIWQPDFSLNLTGSGFGGVTEIANTTTAPK